MNDNMEAAPPKTAKQLKKEAEKKAKMEKFNAKKQVVINTNTEKKEKKKKELVKDAIEYTGNTHPGEKKDVTINMPSTYSPGYVEAAWYAWWKKQGFFKPEYGRRSIKDCPKGKFVMVIPPPNVTGTLHIGHALTNSIEDALTRWNRMRGRLTLWNPGCDHAGIATQVVVEKKLWRDSKQNRHDIGREAFIQKIWDWKNEKGGRIFDQLERLGSSLDWDRARFTMDEKCSKAVVSAFTELHDNGEIYRSNRLVHWSCTLKSAISDIEVDNIELNGRTFLSVPGYDSKIEFGVIVHFAYEIISEKNEKEYLTVATTRIETMLGDTAVAVHPKDTRYKHLDGKFVKHPFCKREIPIVFDEFVEMGFGTGAVKITPAHDANDYEVGIRNKLPFINIFSDDGLIIGDYGEFKFEGMKRFEARKVIIDKLKELGLYREVKENAMSVPICSRSKDIVEPLLKPQWYVKCDAMAEKAIEAVQNKELIITPATHEKTWYHWMKNIRDWCISRQLWWGHRIPAYRVFSYNPESKAKYEQNEFWVSAESEEKASEKACAKFDIAPNELKLVQDPDVLDTWFSSALFPLSVFGWPDKTEELEVFYPNTHLETGHDILFFWVARMVFFGQRFMNKLPFKEVILHPMVRDAHGRKMSKSLGNVIDPMDVIRGIPLEKLHEKLTTDGNLDEKEIEKAKEGQKADYPNGIPECGTDALRFTLCAYMSQARDINLDIQRVQGYRFFCNKLWNAARFSLTFLQDFNPREFDVVSCATEINTSLLENKKTLDYYCSRLGVILNKKNSKGKNKRKKLLNALNDHFSNFSYFNGFQLSNDDFGLHSFLPSLFLNVNGGSGGGNDINYQNELESYPHLRRWRTHISYHRECDSNAEKDSKTTSTMNLWILSRLSKAIEECNRGFEKYVFSDATSACYDLWLYDLCDVYLECIKPVFAIGDEKSKSDAQQTLLHVLDCALRLISPFMPFLSEELYQRLPIHKPAPSICVASYPETDAYMRWRNKTIENEVDIVQKIVHRLRSARTDYNLPKSKPVSAYSNRNESASGGDTTVNSETPSAENKSPAKPQADAYICSSDDGLTKILNHYLFEMKILATWSEIKINETPPEGCAVITHSDKCQIYIDLKNAIDAEKELQKLKKNEDSISKNIGKLKEEMNVPDYESKVPQNVRDVHSEKLEKLTGELEKLILAEKVLENMIGSNNKS